MNILLVCGAGMSSSLIVQKMQKIAPKGTVIQSVTTDLLKEYIDDFDVVLLGPQMRFKEPQIRKLAESKGIPMSMIKPIWYGRLMAKEILDFAMKLVKEKKRKNNIVRNLELISC